jgi:hypothetical protein
MKDVKIRAIFKEATAGATIDRDNGIIKNMILLASESLNGRRYTDNCMNAAIPLFEGAQAYMDHGEDVNRSFRDLVGGYSNVRFEEGKVKGDLLLICEDAVKEKIFNIAEKFPNLAGNSIDASGKYYREGQTDVVEELTVVNSIDIVTKPATTKGFFEEIGEQMIKTLKELKESAPSIFEQAFAEGVDSRNDEVKTLKEANATLTAEKTALELKVSVQESTEKIDSLLKESKLPEDAKTEALRESLIQVGEETAKKIVISMEESINAVGGHGGRGDEEETTFDLDEIEGDE